MSRYHRRLLCWSSETADQVDSVWKADKRSVLPSGLCFDTHTSTVAIAAIQKCGFQLVEDPPYSPDLAPLTTYYLFPTMKKELGGHHLLCYVMLLDYVMNAMDYFLRNHNDTFYTEGIPLLHDHRTKCVNVGGNYAKYIWLSKTDSFCLRPRVYQSPLVCRLSNLTHWVYSFCCASFVVVTVVLSCVWQPVKMIVTLSFNMVTMGNDH